MEFKEEFQFGNYEKIDRNIFKKEIMKMTLFFYNNPFVARNLLDVIVNMFDDFIKQLLFPYILTEVGKSFLSDEKSSIGKITVILNECTFFLKSLKVNTTD